MSAVHVVVGNAEYVLVEGAAADSVRDDVRNLSSLGFVEVKAAHPRRRSWIATRAVDFVVVVEPEDRA